ncbi:unnamed protein product [Effrenium voratum]|nr:unnamed protein product [Effrenium voratum]
MSPEASCGHSKRDLLRRLLVVALPSYPITLVTRCVGLVSTSMVGRHVKDPAALAAVGLSNVITNITGYSALWGFSSGVSTLSSQDWGAGNFQALGLTLQRAYLILVLCVCLPLLVLWLYSERLLIAVGQHPEVAHYVGIYTSVRCWSLMFMPMNCVVTRTLGAMSNVKINLAMSLTASVLNVTLSSTLVPRLGYVGAPLTACICDICECVGVLCLAFFCSTDFRKCWGGFSREAFTGWKAYCKVSLPALVLMCIEWWTWDLQSFIAGFISESAQAVQSVAPAVGDLQYAVGQAFGNGASTVVGNMLGENDPKAAKMAAMLTVVMNATVMLLQASIFAVFRSDVAALFTQNPQILAGIMSLLPFSLIFSLIDGNQSAIAGVLVGAGKQDVGAGIVFFCYWVVGVPLGILLAFGIGGFLQPVGLKGLWIGMLVAVCGHLSMFLVLLSRLNWRNLAEQVRAREESQENVERLLQLRKAQGVAKFSRRGRWQAQLASGSSLLRLGLNGVYEAKDELPDFWFFQTCREFGFYQTCEATGGCMFVRDLANVSYYAANCMKLYNITLGDVQSNIDGTNYHYGGLLPTGTKGQLGRCVMFPNGEVDPWSTRSVLQSPGKDLPTLYVSGASHHAWTWPSRKGDQESVMAARTKIREQVDAFFQMDCDEDAPQGQTPRSPVLLISLIGVATLGIATCAFVRCRRPRVASARQPLTTSLQPA